MDFLPDELILEIFSSLRLIDIIKICQVNTRFYKLRHDNIFWRNKFNENYSDLGLHPSMLDKNNATWYDLVRAIAFDKVRFLLVMSLIKNKYKNEHVDDTFIILMKQDDTKLSLINRIYNKINYLEKLNVMFGFYTKNNETITIEYDNLFIKNKKIKCSECQFDNLFERKLSIWNDARRILITKM